MSWFIIALKKYATFSGRSQRSEYWYYLLFYLIIYVVLILVDGMIGTTSKSGIGILSGIFALGMLLPSLAVAVRRLHDTGRTGWWILINFIPLIGFIVLLVFFVQDSESGANKYGDNPKAAT